MDTKTTYDEALQILINKIAHCPESDRVYVTVDDENGYNATTANFKLNNPEYTYVGTLGERRKLERKFKGGLKINTIYNHIYNKLIRLIPSLENMEVGGHQTSKASSFGYMDLHLDVLSEGMVEQRQVKVISLAHYYKQNGDLVPDPDMTIRIYSQSKMAEALTFQNCYIYQQIYPTQDTVNLTLKKQLNSFLRSWLNNCIRHGHRLH
jgi:uncharacterized protein YqiB (DUF1249 family)